MQQGNVQTYQGVATPAFRRKHRHSQIRCNCRCSYATRNEGGRGLSACILKPFEMCILQIVCRVLLIMRHLFQINSVCTKIQTVYGPLALDDYQLFILSTPQGYRQDFLNNKTQFRELTKRKNKSVEPCYHFPLSQQYTPLINLSLTHSTGISQNANKALELNDQAIYFNVQHSYLKIEMHLKIKSLISSSA